MLLVKNATIYPITSPPIENGDLLIDGGKIAAIGQRLQAPADAQVIDAAGKIVMPGIIEAHSHLGLFEDSLGFRYADGNECSDPVTPHMRAIDGLNPRVASFDDARRAGITTAATGPGSGNVIGGTFAIIKTKTGSVGDITIESMMAMKCAFGENPKRVYGNSGKAPVTRMGIAALLRETLFKAREYRDKNSRAGDDISKMADYDLKMEAMQPVIAGQIPLKTHCHRADDILTALRIKKEFNLKMTLEHCTEGHLVAEQIAAAGVPAIVGPTFGMAGKFETAGKSWTTPKVLTDAGVLVAITTDHPVGPIEYLPLCAGLAMKAGLSESDALKALTINPATIIGIEKRLGSLEVGKDGDILIADCLPLYSQSRTLITIIDGSIVYQSSSAA